MKKVILVATVSIFVIFSCKKQYDCECTTTDSDEVYPTQSVSHTIIGKKKDVIEECEKGNRSDTASTITVVCEVK